MTNWKIVIVAGIVVGLLASCASTRKSAPAPATTPSRSTLDESFDPLSLNDDDITFPREANTRQQWQEKQAASTQAKKPNVLVNGFRVQLMATKEMQTAELIKREAMEKFAPDSINVYVEFDSPYYKIRICDCKTRDEAERVKQLAIERGYRQAWIVRTRVWSNPPRQEVPLPAQSENP